MGESGISDHVEAAFNLHGENRRLSSFRIDLLVTALPPSVALFLSLLLINPFLSDAGDNATYMILARSLANGDGFALLSEPGSPPFKLYPYAYPALLALQMLVFGADQELAAVVVPLKVSTALFFAGSVWLTHHLVSVRVGRTIALLTSLVAATSPLALRWSADIMSEVPFLFFTLLAIWLVERAVRARPTLAQDLAAAVSLSFAFYIRSIGAVLIIAALAYVLLRGGTRRAMAMALLVLVLSVPWIHQQTGATAGPSYFKQYSSDVVGEARGSSDGNTLPLAGLASRTAANLKTYAIHQIPEAMFPGLSGLFSSLLPGLPLRLAGVAKLIMLLIIVLGWTDLARARLPLSLPFFHRKESPRARPGIEDRVGLGANDEFRDPARTTLRVPARRIGLPPFGRLLSPGLGELYVVISVAALSLWWPIDRLLVPLVPFLALYLVVGLRRLAAVCCKIAVAPTSAYHGFSQGLLTALLLAPIVVSSLLVDFSAVNSNAARRDARTASEHFAGTMPDYANFFLAAEWLKLNSPPDSVVLSLKPTMLHVYSGRLAIDSPRQGSPVEILRFMESNGVEFVVEDGFAWNKTSSRIIDPTIRAYQDRFVPAYVTASPVTRVWRFTK